MECDHKIDRGFVSEWHPRYDEIEQDEAEYQTMLLLTKRDLTDKKTLTKQTFVRMIDWKSPRVKGIIRLNEFQKYEEGVRVAYFAEEDQKMDFLLPLYGVGAPVASTILHFMYPNSFPIIDFRTAEILNRAGLVRSKSTAASRYTSFRSAMLTILKEVSPFTLRQMDRAIFSYHKIQPTRIVS